MNKFDRDHCFAATPIDPRMYEDTYQQHRTEIMAQRIPETEHGLALDIGCGVGHYTRILNQKGWRTTAIDSDSSNIEAAKDYASETHVDDAISVLQRLPANQYDLALLLEIVEHMPKQLAETLLTETCRVLKHGGLLLLSTPNKISPVGIGHYYWGEKIRGWPKWYAWDRTHEHIYSSFEIIKLVKKFRFTVEKVAGYWYQGYLPLIGKWKLPILLSRHWPLNRFGFKIILECRKKQASLP